MKRIEAADAAGKTLRGVFVESGRVAIVFDDGTYVGLNADDAWIEEDDIRRHHFSRPTLVAAGFYTDEELDAIDAAERRDLEASRIAAVEGSLNIRISQLEESLSDQQRLVTMFREQVARMDGPDCVEAVQRLRSLATEHQISGDMRIQVRSMTA